MTAVAPQTHLKQTSKVVNQPDTLFLPGGSNLGDGHFQFSSGLRTIVIHVVLQERRLQVCLRRSGGHLKHFSLINVSFELTSYLQILS